MRKHVSALLQLVAAPTQRAARGGAALNEGDDAQRVLLERRARSRTREAAHCALLASALPLQRRLLRARAAAALLARDGRGSRARYARLRSAATLRRDGASPDAPRSPFAFGGARLIRARLRAVIRPRLARAGVRRHVEAHEGLLLLLHRLHHRRLARARRALPRLLGALHRRPARVRSSRATPRAAPRAAAVRPAKQRIDARDIVRLGARLGARPSAVEDEVDEGVLVRVALRPAQRDEELREARKAAPDALPVHLVPQVVEGARALEHRREVPVAPPHGVVAGVALRGAPLRTTDPGSARERSGPRWTVVLRRLHLHSHGEQVERVGDDGVGGVGRGALIAERNDRVVRDDEEKAVESRAPQHAVRQRSERRGEGQRGERGDCEQLRRVECGAEGAHRGGARRGARRGARGRGALPARDTHGVVLQHALLVLLRVERKERADIPPVLVLSDMVVGNTK